MTASNRVDFFVATLNQAAPPSGLTAPLLALWHEGKGDWDCAHRIVQSDDSTQAARVHAYLHRKEGDAANAQYWYSRAGIAPAHSSLPEEWRNLVAHFLDQSSGASVGAHNEA